MQSKLLLMPADNCTRLSCDGNLETFDWHSRGANYLVRYLFHKGKANLKRVRVRMWATPDWSPDSLGYGYVLAGNEYWIGSYQFSDAGGEQEIDETLTVPAEAEGIFFEIPWTGIGEGLVVYAREVEAWEEVGPGWADEKNILFP